VAIVDAFGDSNAESDLAVFRAQYGLPPCTTANGCFRKADQNGGTNYPPDDTGWALETSLDLDAVSAACPDCNILLVEAHSDSFDPAADIDDLGTAVDTAAALGARYVSNSYGAGDINPGSLDSFYNHPGVAVTASTGDTGNAVNWPSSDPNVVAAGGTTLTRDISVPRGWDESAWASGGSGCSAFEPQPGYQSSNGIDTGCANRATADISADADPASGLATYDTLGQNGWLQIGGTSLSSPLTAAMYALAGTPTPGTYPVTYPYDPAKASGLFDVTSGSDGTCGNALCQAGPGWDGPTGMGSPDGVSALASSPHGDIAGTVTNATTGAPVPGATLSTPQGYLAHTDSTGHYDINALTGSYDVTAADFGYTSQTQAGVQVNAGQTSTVNFSLTPLPSSTVSGTVTDGSGHGWPLYAKITIDGYPGGAVYTDPQTGRYSVRLPQQTTLTMHVSPVYEPGYTSQRVQFGTGTTSSLTQNVSLGVDTTACDAPGYGWNGASEDFTGWTGTNTQDGWSVQGSGHTWEFDNPGSRPPPPNGNSQFAVADSNFSGHTRMDTSLVSPVVDLSAQSSPEVSFDTAYFATPKGESASVDLSLDGGATWATIWHQSTANAIGHTELPIPQAAHHSAVRVRFHYTGSKAWWWAVDNVFVGTHTCVPLPGGLVEGLVSDTSGQPLTGALITSNDRPREFAVSVATPDDPNLPDGFYWLFSSLTGKHPFAASDPGHTSSTLTFDVAPSQITRQDWTLAPGA
jgi:Carboxypeptidase regulatory-like domain